MSQAQKLLFVCSQNRLRSLTAEHMLRGFLDYAVKSAGTSPKARVRVNEGHIGWADLIIAMEKKHVRLLKENFTEALHGKRIICLNIPDIYRYMDPALIDELKARLSPYIEMPE
jgi:predicted protein tyrosine phosphatase